MSKVTISCIGDSLTEGDYGIKNTRCVANVHKENYPYFLSLLTGGEVRNFGHCGFRSSNILEIFKQGYIDVTGSDIIIIMLGTNGGQTLEGNSEDDKAYIEIINLCKTQAKDAVIYICTPPHVTTNPMYSNCGYLPLVEPARGFVRKISKEFNLKLIELDKCDKFTDETEDIMQANDGLHFVEVGYRTLAEVIYNHIIESL